MAITSEDISVRVNLLLNNGVSPTGLTKTVSLTLGSLSNVRYDDQKAVNIVNALYPCLDRSVYGIRRTRVAELSDE